MPALYWMVALLILAVLFPPWETPPERPPEFLGFHFILSPPNTDVNGGEQHGIISRLLLTVELTTITIGGLYLSWILRKNG